MLSDAIWKRLERSSSASSAGLVVVRLHPESPLNIFAALDPSTDRRFLLLKSNQPDLSPNRALPTGHGFCVRFAATPADPDGTSCLQFVLTDVSHIGVFDVIGNDALRHVLQAPGDAAAFSAFVSRITEWQHFLSQLPREGLTEAEQQGLFGELWFMRNVLFAELDPSRSILAWAGPQALAKDFQFTDLAIEVKASSTKQHTKFAISNEMQLDTSGVGTLIVYGLLLERLVGGGMSLPELVSAVRTDVEARAPETAGRLSELLLQVGYFDAHAAIYTTRFAVRSELFFDVRDGFPRIVAPDLRPGVGDVRYSIMASECAHYSLTEEEARALIRNTR